MLEFFIELNFCDIWAMVFLYSYVIMQGNRLREAVSMTESTVLGFQRKNSSFFRSIKGLLRLQYTFRGVSRASDVARAV